MKAAVLGFGTIGRGVYEMLKAAPGMDCVKVLVREGKADRDFKTSRPEEIFADEGIELVAEAMGGIEPAFSYAKAALMAGKHFVTSNKALVAEHGLELDALARQQGRAFLFSAACGGGMPFLHNLSLAVKTDSISSLGGILNGTTNYMLDCMQRLGLDYAEALKQAQSLGYAEADPTADVSGLDALRKIMLASAVGFDCLPTSGLLNEGIEQLRKEDVLDFKDRGLCCRLIAKAARNADGGISAWVEPRLFPMTAAECSVLSNFNMARYEGESCGPMVFMGQGAGRYPTASAVLRDISCIEGGLYHMLSDGCRRVAADNSQCMQRYYVRLPEAYAELIPAAERHICGGEARLITDEISVLKMHELAKALRKEGAGLFFGALGE